MTDERAVASAPVSPTSSRTAIPDDRPTAVPSRHSSAQGPQDLSADLPKPNDDHYLAEHLSLPRELALIAVLAAGQLFTQASLAISIVPLLLIAPELGMVGDGQQSWATAAYSLTVGTGILLSGRWGDCYGHKLLTLIGWLWASTFLIISGAVFYSHSQIAFDICRALTGFGFAIVLPNTIAIMGTSWRPGRRQHMCFSFYGSLAPGGFVLGALISGIIGQVGSYPPGIFFCMGGLVAAIGVIGQFVIPPPRIEDARDKADRNLDIWGSLTVVSGLILVNFAFNQGPVVGWPTVYVYVLLIVGIAFLALFAYIETRAEDPLVPVALLGKDIWWILAIVACGWGSFGSWIYYLISFFEVYQGLSPLASTARMVPCAISGAIAAFTSGLLISKIGAPPILLLALVCFTVGNILLATMGGGETYWGNAFVAIIVTPWGMDCSFPSANIIMSSSLPRRHQGIGASLTNATINYSISIFLGFSGLVAAKVNPDGSDVLKGYRGAWYFSIGIAALGTVLAFALNVEKWREDKKRSRKEGNEVLDDKSRMAGLTES